MSWRHYDTQHHITEHKDSGFTLSAVLLFVGMLSTVVASFIRHPIFFIRNVISITILQTFSKHFSAFQLFLLILHLKHFMLLRVFA
jgi:hypothetical protein